MANSISPTASISLPERLIGMVAPLLATCEVSYQFYRLQAAMGTPWKAALAEASVDLQEFTPLALEEADSRRLEPAVRSLVHKGAELLILAGVPIVSLRGWDYWRGRLATLSDTYGLPIVSDFVCALRALEAVGAKRVAVANKWDAEINKQLATDIEAYSDLRVVGIGTDPHSANQIAGLRPHEGVESSRIACRRALDVATEAPDALFLAGGAWYSTLATASLEQEFEVPIVTNPGAAIWYALDNVDCYKPIKSFGQLYAVSPKH